MAKKRIPDNMGNALPNITVEELAASKKASKAMPTWKEIGDAFGPDAVRTKTVNLDPATPEGAKNRGKMLDLMTPAWRAEAERGTTFGEKIEKVAVTDPRGNTKYFPQELVDNISRQNGFKSVASWGTRRKRLMTITREGGLIVHE